ncbi:portal protein [Freshwater phage uvFW-CGR-AMD-COM-C455]|nr:portal protein [Freshwater phage uvFW-CGR-AMD-COM-C455]
MVLSINEVANKVENLKRRYAARDTRMGDVLQVRRGEMTSLFGDYFPEGMSKPMIANFIDVAARDVSEVLAPLPSFNCVPSDTTKDRARNFADKRTMIVNNIVQTSRLQTQMYTGADWYITFGFLPIVVEPDYDERLPRIRVESPLGAYPEFDRYGRCVSYAKRYMKTVGELVIDFPEYESKIMGGQREFADLNAILEMIRYEDKDQIILFLPSRKNLVLQRTENPIGDLTVRIARRPGIDEEPRGQFDDVLWVQLARAQFATLAMQAAERSVQAPLALPDDVDEFAFGPDAIIRSQRPDLIRRVGLDLPTAAFTEQNILEREIRLGSRYPEGRTGSIDASVITGQGVQALMGGFDTQIKTGQQVLSDAFEDVLSLCLKMDEKLFDDEKTVRGTHQGAPYEITYKPSKDIKNDYHVQVRYGLMSGLDPSRALIFSLQALQAGLVSKDFVMRELPWSMNVGLETQQVDIERLRDNLNGAISAMTQAIPAMATQGQDPSDLVEKIAKVIDARKKGTTVEDAVLGIFKKEELEVPEVAEQPQMSPAVEPGAPVEEIPQEQMGAPGEAAPAGATPPPDIAAILAQLGG